MSFFKTIGQNLGKALTVGATNFMLVSLLSAESGEQEIRGMKLKFIMPLVLAGASLISDMTHDFVLSHIPQSRKYAQAESALLSLASAGGATALLMRFVDNTGQTNQNMINVALIGALSDAGGHFIYNNFVDGILI